MPKRYYREYSTTQITKFNTYLSSVKNNLTTYYSLEVKYAFPMSNIANALDEYIPKKFFKDKIPPKYPLSLKASIKEKAKIWRSIKKDPSKFSPLYNSISINIKKEIRNFYMKNEIDSIQRSTLISLQHAIQRTLIWQILYSLVWL